MFIQMNLDVLKSKKNSNFKTIFNESKDKFLKYYRIHFSIHEERFYGHIENLKFLPKVNLFRNNISNVNEITNKFSEIKITDFNNFGCCIMSKSKLTNEIVVLKHIFNSYSNTETESIMKETAKILMLDSANIEKLSEEIVIDNNEFQSIWYVYEYNPSISLDLLVYLLHKRVIKCQINSENDFVHLLYTCNSTLDQSKESFPEFINIIRTVFIQLLMGVSFLHERGMIHKYLNPTNIRLTKNGILKITDLGWGKDFRLIQYCPRALIELGLDMDFLSYRNPLKRIRCNGNYYYTEPHIRALYLREKSLSKFSSKFSDSDFHADYFSCSMIIFEMIFGFTYGDIELYKNYSFYEQFQKYELIFFFPEHYINIIKNISHLEMAIKDFNKFRLEHLKSFLINHENGLIDFLIGGLNSNTSRWKKYFKISSMGQYLDFSNLQKEIPFFQQVNLNGAGNKIPLEFIKIINDFIQLNNFPNFSHKLINKKVHFNLQLDNIQSNKYNFDSSFDSKSFYIPELTGRFVNNSSSKRIGESSDPVYHEFSAKNRVLNSKNIKEKITNIENDVIDESTNEISDRITNEIKYPSVFVHELFKNLETKKSDGIVDQELHNFMKFQMENVNNKQSEGVLLNSQNRYKIPSNCKIEKRCIHHKKYLQSHQKEEKLNSTNNYSEIPSSNMEILTKENPKIKKLSADMSSLSQYQLKQYDIYNYFQVERAKTQLENSENQTRKFPPTDNDSNNEKLKSSVCCSNNPMNFNETMLKFDLRTSFKDITTSGSTKSPKQIEQSKNQSNTMFQLPESVLKELKSKTKSQNHTNYLQVKINESNKQNTKCIYLDRQSLSRNSKFFQDDSSTIPLEKFEIKKINDPRLNRCETSPMRVHVENRKRKFNHTKTSYGINKISSKKYNLLDSNVISLFRENPKLKQNSKQKDEYIQTKANELPVIDYVTLISNSRRIVDNKAFHPSTSVIPLKSQESQTELNQIDQSCNTIVLNSNSVEIQITGIIENTDNISTKSAELVPIDDDNNDKKLNENDQKQLADNYKSCRETGDKIDSDYVETETPKIHESVDIWHETEIEHPNLIFEEKNIIEENLSSELINKELNYCNQNQLSNFNNGLLEETIDPSERIIESLEISPMIDRSLIFVAPEYDSNMSNKSVSFRSPLVSDIFAIGCNVTCLNECSKINLKSILKETNNSTANESEITNDMAYFYRPKIDSYNNTEIIDDWVACEESITKNYLNQDFDLRTIESSRLMSITTASTFNIGPTASDLLKLDKTN